nr:hypothetical protein [Escherichia coli]
MLHTLTDQIHFHRRKTCSPVQDGIEHHGQVFVVFIEPAGVIAFLHNQAKAARLAGQQRLTGCGQRRPDTLRIFCHPATDTAYASRTASRTALISSSVSHSPAYGKNTCVPSAGSTGSDCH